MLSSLTWPDLHDRCHGGLVLWWFDLVLRWFVITCAGVTGNILSLGSTVAGMLQCRIAPPCSLLLHLQQTIVMQDYGIVESVLYIIIVNTICVILYYYTGSSHFHKNDLENTFNWTKWAAILSIVLWKDIIVTLPSSFCRTCQKG